MSQIVFVLVLVAVSYIGFQKYSKVWRAVNLGKSRDYSLDITRSWKETLLVAFGQQKMFKRPVPAILHGFIYLAFLLTQIDLLEIIIDGLIGTHRILAPFLGGIYTLMINMIEVLSVGAFIATIIFLIRRNILKLPRFQNPEMKGWPTRDANLILLGELILVISIFLMNGSDRLLQVVDPEHFVTTGQFLVSDWFGSNFLSRMSQGSLLILERVGWWMHILIVMGFILYLPTSKHLHIFLAFPNVWWAKQSPRGRMENMPDIMNEVKMMFGLIEEQEVDASAELPEFGAKDVYDLSNQTLLSAYTCTECGRCTSVCPANQTGKKLSPRKIMMDIRDRASEIVNSSESVGRVDDGKSLFDYISEEEIFACTSCNACIEACPVLINPLDPILELRRYKILTESKSPSEWLPMFNAVENSGAVWQVSATREDWITASE